MTGERVTEENQANGKRATKAVILLGHGSRLPGAVEDMELVVEHLRRKLDYDVIEICQMSGLGPGFSEVFEECAARGATQIVVVPYFLHFGVHLRQDVPEMLMEMAGKHPHVKLVLSKHLGFDEALVDVVMKRIRESESLCDVREWKPVAAGS